eukprot:CAMPEP_0172303464 /NCGR_PEP_ID=MMETSP1058-20130122/4993_1 /TAXON_ID=83371 /ORGANISM="Detonula confervacea, Strain CCMP 353" /LENGTH=486 /DNA_ID=CAMNT_0013014285 /DNA_START=1 /DNA_END=1461 /DNA_ORIENTATION=+
MKISSIALFSIISVTPTDAIGLRELANKVSGKRNVQAAVSSEPKAHVEGDLNLAAFLDDLEAPASAIEGKGRDLQACDADLAWYGNYPETQDWPNGFCQYTRDCSGVPAFSTNLACCKEEYGGQVSGACISKLESPPTTSPTGSDGSGSAYFRDNSVAWSEGTCINTGTAPDGWPTYATMLECCKGAFGNQMSGMCLAALPTPPTTSPTTSGGTVDFFYPDYDTMWSEAGCLNTAPLPYPRKEDRPVYPTHLECCKGAYGGQMSGKCLAELPSPPTTSPTGSGGADFYYADYETPWPEATCKNDLPLPFPRKEDRPNYDTMLACCKGSFGNQQSGACLAILPSPPTTSPTGSGGADFFYPDQDTAWPEGTCMNALPLPFPKGDRPTYDTMLDCCKGAFGGQQSGACLANLPSPPTTSPTGSDGTGYFRDTSVAWSEGACINTGTAPNGWPQYDTMLACCKGAFGGQRSGVCIANLPSPPTESPTVA